ncbi:MAG: FecR domain-containing protein, partial [Dysgonamonadaceae bacterium]
RYTGKFRQRDGIDEILRIIRKIHPFNIEKDIDNNIITLSK